MPLRMGNALTWIGKRVLTIVLLVFDFGILVTDLPIGKSDLLMLVFWSVNLLYSSVNQSVSILRKCIDVSILRL